MSIIRSFYYDPYSEFDRLFENAISSRFSPTGSVARRGKTAFQPKMNVQEVENKVIATFDLPGLEKKDISISAHHNLLTVSGEVKGAAEHEEGGYAVRERSYGSFSRVLQLPSDVKHEDIKASMEHGVLTVTFPKNVQQAPKTITIN